MWFGAVIPRARRASIVAIIGLALVCLALPARAQLIRDADIEYGLAQLAQPVLRAAGLSPGQVKVLVIDDSSLNAFVVDNRHIFVHAGLIQRLKSASALQAVLAHEAAHIANGHLTRRAANARTARTAAGLGMLLSAAAAAAGNGAAASGIALGSQSSAARQFLAHTRAEESSADLSSVRYLIRAGIDPQGALDVLEIFRGQEVLAVTRQDPYTRSHPLSRDRFRALQGVIAGASAKTQPRPGDAYWFHRVQGKLSAFRRAPSWTLRRLRDSHTKDIAAMREAIAYNRQSNLPKALAAIDRAIALRQGRDPLYADLKGQILLENRRAKEAISVYAAAAKQAGNAPLILGGYGRALLADGQFDAARRTLEAARSRDFRDTRILRDLSVAYARADQRGMASVVTAERYALQGRLKDAQIHAKRAVDLLPRGSGPWNRAQDVLSAARR